MYHMLVAGKHACGEFIHKYKAMYCTVVTLSSSLELAGISTHCTPFKVLLKMNLKSISTSPILLRACMLLRR